MKSWYTSDIICTHFLIKFFLNMSTFKAHFYHLQVFLKSSLVKLQDGKSYIYLEINFSLLEYENSLLSICVSMWTIFPKLSFQKSFKYFYTFALSVLWHYSQTWTVMASLLIYLFGGVSNVLPSRLSSLGFIASLKCYALDSKFFVFKTRYDECFLYYLCY